MNNAIGQKDEAMTKKPPEFNPETAPPALTIDWDAYLPFFENEDISEKDKRELIEALWAIMVSFVDLGFGISPVQHDCGKGVSLATMQREAVLDLNISQPAEENTLSAQFDAVARKESR